MRTDTVSREVLLEEKHPKHGFKTGDTVKAIIPPRLKNAGTHEGRMSARAKGGFKIATRLGTITDVGKNYCRADGYGFSHLRPPIAKARGTHKGPEVVALNR